MLLVCNLDLVYKNWAIKPSALCISILVNAGDLVLVPHQDVLYNFLL